MYRGVPFIHKGHQLPAETFSFTKSHLRSTFAYTNSVLQYAAFNYGQWANYDAEQYTCSLASQRFAFKFKKANLPPGLARQIEKKKTNIVIPSYLWTAGCCVHSNGVVLGPFAFIGNNDQNTRVIQMSHVTVYVIQQFLLLGWRSNCPFVPRKPRVFL